MEAFILDKINNRTEKVLITSEIQNKYGIGLNNRLIICKPIIDIQINGFCQIDFNESNLDEEKVNKVCEQLRNRGIWYIFPTIITNSKENMEQGLQVIYEAKKKYILCDQMIKGVHLEGPYISAEDGPRGAHPIQYVTCPDVHQIEKWQKKYNGLIKIITIAPEKQGTENFLKYCREQHIMVSIGHTNANSDQIHRAVLGGAQCSTHLGNGAHLYLKRHPNYIWDQLSEKELYASIIVDGHHLPDNVVSVIERVKKEKLVLISDGTQFTGCDAGVYETLIGGKVILDENKRLCMQSNQNLLAGAAMDLLEILNRIKRDKILEISYAIDCMTIHPRALLRKSCEFDENEYIVLCERENDIVYIQEGKELLKELCL